MRYCTACESKRNLVDLSIHETSLDFYCEDNTACGAAHLRPDEGELIPFSEQDRLKKHLEDDYGIALGEKLFKMITTQSHVAIMPDVALYLAKYSKANNTGSVTATINAIVRQMMKEEPLDDVEPDAASPFVKRQKGRRSVVSKPVFDPDFFDTTNNEEDEDEEQYPETEIDENDLPALPFEEDESETSDEESEDGTDEEQTDDDNSKPDEREKSNDEGNDDEIFTI